MGLKLIFLIVTRAVSLLGLLREWWWKDAEILMLRHQLAVAERDHPRSDFVDVRLYPAEKGIVARSNHGDLKVLLHSLIPQF